MNFAPEFKHEGLTVLLEKRNGDVIAAYTSEYKGRKNFQIRALFKDQEGNLRPSKDGFSVLEDDKDILLAAFAALAKKG